MRSYINTLVIATTELETRASLIYTLALLKRRPITPGVEQVAELIQRLSKTEGLLEKLGIDWVGPKPQSVTDHFEPRKALRTHPLTLWSRSSYRRNPVSAKYHTRNSRHSNRYGSVNPKHD
jgi:hypothetical protein